MQRRGSSREIGCVEDLILVDESDQIVGHLDKERCHDGAGHRHRAFSIFLQDDAGRLVLQRRSGAKRLWGKHWSNSVCSHPRRGEDTHTAAQRRLQEELGVQVPLLFLFQFEYRARFQDHGSEHELCSVYWGRLTGEECLRCDPDEIDAVRYVSPATLTSALQDDPESYTPWLHLEWRRIREEHGELLVDPVASGRASSDPGR
jgi:isopentenyl-diphosphate delta-isomerase